MIGKEAAVTLAASMEGHGVVFEVWTAFTLLSVFFVDPSGSLRAFDSRW